MQAPITQPPLRPFDEVRSDTGPWQVQYWKSTTCPHLGKGGPHTFNHRVRTGLYRRGNHNAEHKQREAMYLWCIENFGSSSPPRWACDEGMMPGADRVETLFYFVDERDAILFRIMCC